MLVDSEIDFTWYLKSEIYSEMNVRCFPTSEPEVTPGTSGYKKMNNI